jgi:hypothetical protein
MKIKTASIKDMVAEGATRESIEAIGDWHANRGLMYYRKNDLPMYSRHIAIRDRLYSLAQKV